MVASRRRSATAALPKRDAQQERRGHTLALSPSHKLKTALNTFSVRRHPSSPAISYTEKALSASRARTNPTRASAKALCRFFGDSGKSSIPWRRESPISRSLGKAVDMLTLPVDADDVPDGGCKVTSLSWSGKTCPPLSTKLDGKRCSRPARLLPRFTGQCGVAMKVAALDNDTTPVAVLLATPTAVAAAAAAVATAAAALLKRCLRSLKLSGRRISRPLLGATGSQRYLPWQRRIESCSSEQRPCIDCEQLRFQFLLTHDAHIFVERSSTPYASRTI